MEGALRRTLYVVCLVEEYDIMDTHIYTDKLLAERKFVEIGRRLFEDHSVTDFQSIEDYQHSEEWWDEDERCRVSFETVLGEVNENY